MVKKDEFTPEGEALGYISLDQATLRARTLAMQDEERYRERLGWDELVWVVSSAETEECGRDGSLPDRRRLTQVLLPWCTWPAADPWGIA